MKRLIPIVMVGCSFSATPTQGLDARIDPPGVDAADGPNRMIDAMEPPMLDARACFGVGLVKVCFTTLPATPVTLSAAIDTGVDTNCTLVVQAAGANPAMCVIAGPTVTVSGTVTATGPRPLVLVGFDRVTVEAGGTLDVSSVRGVRKGAGAGLGGCGNMTGPENDNGGGGGGGGGGFGTKGGRGGKGDRNDNSFGGMAQGGAAGGTQVAAGLRGGCAGSKGGDGRGQNGGLGGDGGGSVAVIAGRLITITGAIYASGAGGTGNPDGTGVEQGGGGGGSGGMIALDAPTIDVTGRLAANGGGGGGGGDLQRGGGPGGDGSTQLWDQRAAAGARAPGNNVEATGAEGTAIGHIDAIDPGDADGGAGGGAGGLGYIRTDGTLTGTMISPAPDKH